MLSESLESASTPRGCRVSGFGRFPLGHGRRYCRTILHWLKHRQGILIKSGRQCRLTVIGPRERFPVPSTSLPPLCRLHTGLAVPVCGATSPRLTKAMSRLLAFPLDSQSVHHTRSIQCSKARCECAFVGSRTLGTMPLAWCKDICTPPSRLDSSQCNNLQSHPCCTLLKVPVPSTGLDPGRPRTGKRAALFSIYALFGIHILDSSIMVSVSIQR